MESNDVTMLRETPPSREYCAMQDPNDNDWSIGSEANTTA